MQQRFHTAVGNGELQSLYLYICSWSSLRCELGTIRASHVAAGTLNLLQGRETIHLQGDSLANASDNISVSVIVL